MRHRILFTGFFHETNTYCSALTSYENFRIGRRGDEGFDDTSKDGYFAQVSKSDFFTRMVKTAAELEADLIPTYFACYRPSGTIEASTYARIKADLVAEMKAALPADGVVVFFHGAGVAEGVDDVDGDLAAAVRLVVGPNVPITSFYDLHGNITQHMADQLDAVLPCHEYPHVDIPDRAVEALRLIPRLLNDELRPVHHVERIPILLQPSDTFEGPMKAVNQLCAEIEERPRIIECGVFHGFPYCDTPLCGIHVIATADRDKALAVEAAQEVAQFIWEHREDYLRRSLTPAEAIAEAREAPPGLVVINDTSDNVGGGAPGDGTHLLRAMVEARLDNAAFAHVADPEVVQQAHDAGVGATIRIRLGGKTDELHGSPLEVDARVKTLTDGVYAFRELYRGGESSVGRSARLVIEGIDVVVIEKPAQVVDSGVFMLHGIDVDLYRIVGLKGSNHFREGFEHRAVRIVTADSPGLTTLMLDVFDRQRTLRPIWPLDPETTYLPAAAALA